MSNTKFFNATNIVSLVFAIILTIMIVFCYLSLDKLKKVEFSKNINTLNETLLIDTAWDAELLKTHNNQLTSFDAVANYYFKMRSLQKSLANSELARNEVVGENIVNQYQIYTNYLDAKSDFIEHYKANQAIFRNSVRYATKASRSVYQKLLEQKLINAEHTLGNVTLALDHFILFQNTSPMALNRFIKQLDALSDLPENIGRKINNIISHAKVVINYREKVSTALNNALNNETKTAVVKLIDSYNKFYQQKNQIETTYQQVMWVCFSLLIFLGLWLYIRNYKYVTQSNDITEQLVISNKQLDEKARLLTQLQNNIEQTSEVTFLGYCSEKLIPKAKLPLSTLYKSIESLKTLETAPSEKIINTLSKNVVRTLAVISKINNVTSLQQNTEENIEIDLNQIIKKAMGVYCTQPIKISTNLVNNANLSGSPRAIFQLVTLLLQNAVEACEKTSDDNEILLRTWFNNNNHLAISVQDNGVGMNQSMEKKIFEPFFSGDKDKQKMGLGLTIVKSIVDAHNGSIKITTAIGKGAIFIVVFNA